MSTKTESTEEIKKDNSGQSSLMDWIGSFGAEDIGVDIGTSNIVLYVKHKGLIFSEASVLARNEITHEYFAFGTKGRKKWKERLPMRSVSSVRCAMVRLLIITVLHTF